MVDKEKVKPIYSELQGYLSQAPKDRNIRSSDTPEGGLWGQVNKTIDELNKVTGKDYNRYRMVPKRNDYHDITTYSIHIDAYRTGLGGLISRLHAEYFSNEPAPFSGMPSTIISQTQQQSQSFQVQMLLEIQSKIDEKIYELEPEDKKRGFLEKVKGALTSARNTSELVTLLLAMAQEFGLTIKELLELFK